MRSSEASATGFATSSRELVRCALPSQAVGLTCYCLLPRRLSNEQKEHVVEEPFTEGSCDFLFGYRHAVAEYNDERVESEAVVAECCEGECNRDGYTDDMLLQRAPSLETRLRSSCKSASCSALATRRRYRMEVADIKRIVEL